MDNDFATGYALGSDSASGDRNNSGFWGGDGWWAIIIFAMIFGWGNGGWGGFGGGNGGGYAATAATQADIQRGFDNSAVIGKLDGIGVAIIKKLLGRDTEVFTDIEQTL